jgi:hypothetical protein
LEASRRYETSWEDSFVSVEFDTVKEEATSQEDWDMYFSSVTERETSEADWTTGFSLVKKGVGLRV